VGMTTPQPFAGYRVSGVLKAHPGMTVADFEERWIEGHVIPYSLRVFKRLAGLRCNVVIQDELGTQPFDGTQDLWWRTREDMEADLGAPERDEVSAHVREILEPIDLPLREFRYQPDPGSRPGAPIPAVRPGPTPGIKVIALLKANEAMPIDALQRELIEDHIPNFTAPLERVKGLRCSLVDQDVSGKHAFDAVEELWWESSEDFDADVASKQGDAAHNNMWRFMTAIDLIVKEYVFIADA
jgi:hypothetical protein